MAYGWLGGLSMRKTISVTNPKVLEIMSNSENASKLIEEAILYYMERDKNYITRSEVLEMIANIKQTPISQYTADLETSIADMLNL